MQTQPKIHVKTAHWAMIMLAFQLFILSNTLPAQQCKPLLITGKKTLFQRVITQPGATLYTSANESAEVLRSNMTPFTVLYVYERISVNGTGWMKVGASSNCKNLGWIKSSKATDWKQSLTLVFTERTGRQPVLFFKYLEALGQVAGSQSPADHVTKLASQFKAIQTGQGSPPDDFAVIAMEPFDQAVSRKRFYLMPIFETVELFEGVKFLKLASIDPGSGEFNADIELRTGIVFVIDTTISMKPYIERTQKAVRKIYDAIEDASLADKVAFGLVAFRSNTDKTPDLGYVSKLLSNLRDGRARRDFESALANAEEAPVSTHSFNEDAFAGIKTAIEQINWSPYQSRIIFLISDAGAIRNDDPYSVTGMNEPEIADLAEANGIKMFVLHLRTPLGRKINNHAYAEAQYKALTKQTDPTIGNLYVPIDATQTATGVQTFGQAVEEVATQMVELVRATSSGERLQLPDNSSLETSDVVTEAKRKAAILGYSMQLEYLGRKDRAQAPRVVTSWVSDMDLTRPDVASFNVTVLLTKNQLSDLYQRLKIVLDQAQRTKRTGDRDFFQSIVSAAAQITRDPIQFSKKPNQNLGQLGLLGEFIDDLPYRSSILRLTEDDWYRMSVGEQQALIASLKSKIKRYQRYHDDVQNWVSFGATDAGDMVYRVPLSVMP